MSKSEISHLSKEESILSDENVARLRSLGATPIQLSGEALRDLRIALRASYGQDFDQDLTDEQVNNLGNLFLTILAEGLMLDISASKLPSIEVWMVK